MPLQLHGYHPSFLLCCINLLSRFKYQVEEVLSLLIEKFRKSPYTVQVIELQIWLKLLGVALPQPQTQISVLSKIAVVIPHSVIRTKLQNYMRMDFNDSELTVILLVIFCLPLVYT